MQRYFLTVTDKNPIMFNDMLCECAWVEIGLQLRGVIFKSLPTLSVVALNSRGVHIRVHTFTCECFFELMEIDMQQFLSWSFTRRQKISSQKKNVTLAQLLKPLKNCMNAIKYILISSTEVMSFKDFHDYFFFQVRVVLSDSLLENDHSHTVFHATA